VGDLPNDVRTHLMLSEATEGGLIYKEYLKLAGLKV